MRRSNYASGMSDWRRMSRVAFAEQAATADHVRPAFRVRAREASPKPAESRHVEVVTSPGGTKRIALVESNSARRDEAATEETEHVEVADASTDSGGLQPEELREERDVCAALRAENEVLRNELARMEDLVSLMAEEASYYFDTLRDDVTDEDDEDDEEEDDVHNRRDEEATEEKEHNETLSETSDELENENAGVDVMALTGSDTLAHISRGVGIASGETLGALVDAHAGARVARCLAGDAVVSSVEFSETVDHLFRWTEPSIELKEFLRWLQEAAPTFPSFTVPENVRSMFDDGATGCLREFVASGVADGDKFRSPIGVEESNFSRTRHNAVFAAAHALNASDDARSEALKLAEATKNSRRFAVRSTYAWFILCKDGPALVYIGESMDIECRISSHISSLFSKPNDAPTTQRGHRVAQHYLSDDFNMRLFVVSAHDEASARRLAKSYVEFCGSCGGKFPPSILEVARACAASGFYSEAVYTAAFRSMHDESTESCVGLNFAQPGRMYPVAMEQISFQDRLTLALRATTRQGRRSENQLIFCVRCTQWCATPCRMVAHDTLNEYQCYSCYDKQRLKTSTLECEVCFQRKGGRGRPVIHADGRTGVQCIACRNKAIKAARPPWTCQQCGRVMRGDAEQNRHPGGGYRCRMCRNREQKRQKN